MKPDARAGTLARVLLAEDDPVSRAFLAAALAPVAHVETAASGAATLHLAMARPDFDLWLLDARLPDADGADVLSALRVNAPCTPALAHTADPDPARAETLRDAGFVDVLVKPLRAAALRDAVARALGGRSAVAEVAAVTWDDARALGAVRGRQAHAGVLRRLFVAELPVQQAALQGAFARGDLGTMEALWHRLRASCALVGAVELDAAVRAWQAAPRSDSARHAFDVAVDRVLRAEHAAEVGQQVP